ncbi:Magnesium-chelatase 60 kDa subunit [Roseibaca ekhonensis]|uniref:Magnesium-chelatase 60 kDa subunit n=1 Tax=Roseinatronobacter ekhonensis TaxID=254356 RepID=A0A3B0M7A4_9RHOB|nr:magnesium chelatase subunit D [Roseibaca ekhonensis]SUZ31871.1 Magnesium-chelatase 60 kDa subunit [Roseibaca ekhonensis]
MTPFDDTSGPNRPTPPPDPWAQVGLALVLLAVDPAGLRGLWLRGRAGPVRDRVLAALAPLAPRKLHPFMAEDALSGGLDLSATLALNTLQRHEGLLNRDGVLTLTMAERCPPGLSVRLGQALDARPGLALVALDEAAEEGEGLPQALSDRLALFLDIDAFGWSGSTDLALDMPCIAKARARLATIPLTAEALEQLTRVAHGLAIDSLRAPWLALMAARAHAAWRGVTELSEDDLRVAVELVLAQRARALPQEAPPDDTPPPPEPPEDDPEEGRDRDSQEPQIPDDLLIDAAFSALPPGLLARLQAAKAARAGAGNSGAGARRKSLARGRPIPSRPGKPGSGARVDVIATLRQAAPWQAVRRSARPDAQPGRLLLMPDDIRIKRYQDPTDRVLIFVVDASGSAAVARLAEAKGAVEIMLAEAYSARDHVALVTFRGETAELALPPTRSLVQAKRRLAGLPGGGATPLAGAMQVALNAALQARARGMSPTLAFLTDGRGNIALDGSANRAQAGEDATTLARAIAARAIPSLVIDTSLRPKPLLSELSAAMGATRIALPRADARAMAQTLGAALGG